MKITNEEIKMRLHYAKQQSNALMCQMVEVVEQLLAAAPLAAATDNSLPLLQSAIKRMDTARRILTDNNPRPNCNWGMLDTSDLIVGQVAPQAASTNGSKELAEFYDAALCMAAMYVENHCVDGEMHANAILTSKRPDIKESGVLIAWPQATVEPMINERVAFESWVADSGRSHLLERRNGDRGWYTDLTVTAWWTAWEARALLATSPTSKEIELDSVTASKMETLREKGMRQVGVVMADDSGKRATIDMGKVLWSESTSKADTGEAIRNAALEADKFDRESMSLRSDGTIEFNGSYSVAFKTIAEYKERYPNKIAPSEKLRGQWQELKSATSPTGKAFDFTAHLARQAAWSEKTFGPGHRVEMVIDHIRKELLEIEAAPQDLEEWVDLIQLALDGAWRSGALPVEIINAIVAKQTKNEGRTWPDWRTADPTKAIEHDRSKDAAPSEATTDEVIDLAEQLVWVTVKNAINNTAAGASLLNEGEFRSGMELACDEIKARLGFDADAVSTINQDNYEALEKEHFGDPEKQTGIYSTIKADVPTMAYIAPPIKAEQAPDKHPSELSIAGIARKHFGSPIPPAAYAFASELIAATLATIKAEPIGEQL